MLKKRPFKNVPEGQDQTLVKLMDDIVTRIEEKAFQED
jgi:hypothetical protein